MSTSMSMFGEWTNVRIESEPDDEGAIWIRGDGNVICLHLTAEQRDQLRAALDAAEQYATEAYARKVAA